MDHTMESHTVDTLIQLIRTKEYILQGGRRERGSEWGTRVYPWQINVDVWQNQYNIVK